MKMMRVWIFFLLTFSSVSGAVASDATAQSVDQLFAAFDRSGSPSRENVKADRATGNRRCSNPPEKTHRCVFSLG